MYEEYERICDGKEGPVLAVSREGEIEIIFRFVGKID